MAEPMAVDSAPAPHTPLQRVGVVVVGVVIVALLASFAYSRLSRPAGPVLDASYTGFSKPDDVITARQLLMDGNETAMVPIDRAAGGEDIPLATLKDQAYAIYTYLSIAPHLFQAGTKPVVSPDGSPPATAATVAVWQDFDAFYKAAADAAQVAYNASQAGDIAKFRTLAMQLRADCDSCHATYMHVFDPTTGK
jgi:hypothetical protein